MSTHLYLSPRSSQDLDLYTEVRNLMVSHGFTPEQIQIYDNNRYIQDSKDKNEDVQRFLQNRFWNIQLMTCASDSVTTRYSLIPDGLVSDWFRLFQSDVLPFCRAHGLPVQL